MTYPTWRIPFVYGGMAHGCSGFCSAGLGTHLPAAFLVNTHNTLYVVLSGLNGGAGHVGHVFRTTIAASAWSDISPNLNGSQRCISAHLPGSIGGGVQVSNRFLADAIPLR
jgi:hypothetical protein